MRSFQKELRNFESRSETIEVGRPVTGVGSSCEEELVEVVGEDVTGLGSSCEDEAEARVAVCDCMFSFGLGAIINRIKG